MKSRNWSSKQEGSGPKHIGPGSKYGRLRSRNGFRNVGRTFMLSGKVLAASVGEGKLSIGVSAKDLWELIDQEHRTAEVENKMLVQRLRVATGK